MLYWDKKGAGTVLIVRVHLSVKRHRWAHDDQTCSLHVVVFLCVYVIGVTGAKLRGVWMLVLAQIFYLSCGVFLYSIWF